MLPLRRLAALAALLLATAPASPAASMLDAGQDSGHDFTIDPDSIHRDGDTVTFRLVGTSSYRHRDDYDAQVMVDCARRQRREMGSVINSQFGGVKHNRPDAQLRDIFPNTRQASELELVCRLAGVPLGKVSDVVAATAPPAPAPTPAAPREPDDTFGTLPPLVNFATPAGTRQPPAVTSRTTELDTTTASASDRAPATIRITTRSAVLPAGDLQALGNQDGDDRAILIDSVHHARHVASYVVQSKLPRAAWAVREHFVVDCQRKLRAFQPEDSPSGARLTATAVAPGRPEARELALACSMPDGPRSRWFAGFVVTPDGVVVAPHARTQGCNRIVTGNGDARRTLAFVANEDDIALLRIAGSGPWPVMPAASTTRHGPRQPVTLLGVAGTEPRVSAAFAEDAGANDMDAGWPQVRMLADHALREGIVWDGAGTAVGLALALGQPVARQGQSWVRMLPVDQVRLRLQRHQVDWKTTSTPRIDAEQAMRMALAATLPLTCEP